MKENPVVSGDEASQRFNLRDYGGYDTIDGARLASGLLFRSAEPDRSEPESRKQFTSLRLDAIVDFRNRHELPCPTERPSTLSRIRIATEDDRGQVPHAIERFRGLSQTCEARAVMQEVYRDMISGPHFLQMTCRYLRCLAYASGPTLVHCVAGKDRTGLVVAIFQSLLGVNFDAIMHEYLLTDAAGQARIDQLLSSLSSHSSLQLVPKGVLDELVGVRPEYLEAAFTVIKNSSDDTADYLRRNAGIDETVVAKLRRNYLVV